MCRDRELEEPVRFAAAWLMPLLLTGGACGGSEQPGSEDPNVPAPHNGVSDQAESSFRPRPDGFAFENYGNEKQPENLTAGGIRRLFGDAACASLDDGQCVLSPGAQRFLKDANQEMADGHCEGMAVLSLLFFIEALEVSDFGGSSTFALQLDGNTDLQHEIAHWFTLQSLEPTSSAENRASTPSAVVATLRKSFQTGSNELYTLGICKKGPEPAGHAITPYAVRDKGRGISWIMVYDNNYPGEERHVEVDTVNDTWQYTGATNPNEAPDIYAGDRKSKTLTFTPLSVRQGPHVCPFCGDMTAEGPPSQGVAKKRQVRLDGEADLLISDEQGRRIGYVNGQLVNEIPGAESQAVRAGSSSGGDREPVYHLPLESDLTVALDGARLQKHALSTVSLVAPGYTFSVEQVDLAPGQMDTITFSAKGNQITYRTAMDESPVLELGVQTAGADYSFLLAAVSEAQGQEILIRVDLQAGELQVRLKSGDGLGAFGIAVHRLHDKGDEVFTHQGIAVSRDDTLYLGFGKWDGNGRPMRLEMDRGSDGTREDVTDLGDEG